MATKAFALLSSNKSVAERATKYVDHIKKRLEGSTPIISENLNILI